MPYGAGTRAVFRETAPWGYTGDMVDNTEIAPGRLVGLATGVAVR